MLHSCLLLLTVFHVVSGCNPGEYSAGYGVCLSILDGPDRVRCPLHPANPPPWGSPTCQGSGGWWWMHVGGARTDWSSGTDAMCLSAETTPRAVAWGTVGCQSSGSLSQCQDKLRMAGCDYSLGCCDCLSTPGGRCEALLDIAGAPSGSSVLRKNLQTCLLQCRKICCKIIWYKNDGTCKVHPLGALENTPDVTSGWKLYRRNNCN